MSRHAGVKMSPVAFIKNTLSFVVHIIKSPFGLVKKCFGNKQANNEIKTKTACLSCCCKKKGGKVEDESKDS